MTDCEAVKSRIESSKELGASMAESRRCQRMERINKPIRPQPRIGRMSQRFGLPEGLRQVGRVHCLDQQAQQGQCRQPGKPGAEVSPERYEAY